MISIFLILSFFVNAFCAFYIRWLVRRMTNMSEDIRVFSLELGGLLEHLDSIYKLEMYYGDETLQKLLDHSREIFESAEVFNSSYTFEEYEEIASGDEEKV